MDLKNFKISTIIVIIALLIIGLYAVTEVTYFSAKNNAEPDNVTSPVVYIPSIGVNEKINNVSISQGVFIDEQSYKPTQGDVVLFGHRTLQGSAFLRLNELKKGDVVSLKWPDLGEINYTIKSSKVVPASYLLDLNESHVADRNHQQLYLITCHPIGSASQRLIYIADYNCSSLYDTNSDQPSNFWTPWLITLGFFIFGLVVTFLFRDKGKSKINQRIILIAVILITIALVIFILFPGSSQYWADNLQWLNGLIGIS